MFCPWVGALWNLTFVFLPRIKGRWGWCLMEAILPRLPSFSNLLIWTHNLFVICTEEKRSKLKLFPHSSSASQLLSLSGLNAFNRNWKPGRTTKYGCCWFRSKPCPDLTFQSFFFFQEFLEYVQSPFSYFRRQGFICLKHYFEILVIIQKTRLPLPLKSLSSFVLESAKYVTTPSHVPFLRKESCEIHCEASC